MRNSVVPMVLVGVVVAVALLAISSQDNPGLDGPDLNPGIFRLPKKDKFPVASAALSITNTVTTDGPVPSTRGESWRLVTLMAQDRHPLTRSTVLGLAEQLTAHGCVTIIAPVAAPAYPMGVNRIITVASEDTHIPQVLGGEAAAKLVVKTMLARVPATHPAALLLPDPEGPTSATLTITHRSVAQSPVPAWSNWWAGEGRNLAAEILKHLAVGGLPPVVDPQTRTWLTDLTPLSDWGSALVPPPTTDQLHWQFAFQEALVRGWVGVVPGLTTTNRQGVEEPTLDQLLKRMVSGSWEAAGAPGTRLFTRKHQGHSEWFSITSSTDQVGWSVVWWMERSGLLDHLVEWVKAAEGGDKGAARLLRAHRNYPGLPKEWQEAVRASGLAK